ncbi:hypothetical protein Ddye_027030 [Dipteronia dyeriana]|uniref:RNase H type-1 domain-containing protein n=1 Tax=Dipteronia dyeriana TaxID=168575 RepID=A0AAD9TPA1_9ROSI|nr:hypothetical protein Ddye_027030 [Dipteronia dyeriana]
MGEWTPPPVESLKFNVDGSARGFQGSAGIGGVLRDHRGKIQCMFSAFIGMHDAITAEIQAIARASDLCLSKLELRGRNIVIVSDSKVAVSWVNGEGISNIQHVQSIYDIRCNLKSLGQAKVVYNSRMSKTFADHLAKKGSGNEGDMLTWNDFG